MTPSEDEPHKLTLHIDERGYAELRVDGATVPHVAHVQVDVTHYDADIRVEFTHVAMEIEGAAMVKISEQWKSARGFNR